MPQSFSPRTTFLSDVVRTGLVVAVSDGLFASATGMFIAPYATPFRVFRGVASVVFGRAVLNGGVPWALVGIAMHICVAMFWSGVFILALRNSALIRDAIQSWPTAILVAAIYGPFIYLVMTMIVIPAFLHRPPTIGTKWWVQLIGHAPFVVMPMILMNRNRARESVE